MSRFYVTTPIYYVNDQPHIGHAYCSLAADILSRFNRMHGLDVFFLTGTDEHGQKVEQAASARGLSPKAHADLMVGNFQSRWHRIGLTNDAFIRTTDEEHKAIVQSLLSSLYEKGEIVSRTYKGWYCTPCERFWTEKDLASGGTCPDCGRSVEEISEDNYFFLMSRYADRLIKHIEDNPRYIMPETRRNEVLGFLKSQPLGDLCISRPKKRLSWGIPLPFNEDYVTYVWFDALINYYSATKYLAPRTGIEGNAVEWWPADVHLIGKDILTTHAVYWSAMLMAMEMPLPKTIFAHGWWTIEGRKMSKSIGNVVDPADIVARYGGDALRYFLFRELPFGLDGDFSESSLIQRINTDLANDFGNLASRALAMAARFCDGKIPRPGQSVTDAEHEMKAIAEGMPFRVDEALSSLRFNRALEEIWRLVSYANKYIDSNAPWVLAKDPANHDRLSTVMYNTLEALRVLSLHLHPFMPDATAKLYDSLGCEGNLSHKRIAEESAWGRLAPGLKLKKLDALFPRIEAAKPESTAKEIPKQEKKVPESSKANEESKQQAEPADTDGLIAIQDFMKVELKTAVVLSAERVPKSDKLIRIEVDSGEPEGRRRQIVAGIGKAYAPEDLVGKVVIVVANLKPAKLMGVASEGMLLAATGEDGVPVILAPERPTASGLRVK